MGKVRARQDGGAKPVASWLTLVLSSGELSVAAKMLEGGSRVRAGQEVRVVEIDADAGKGFKIFTTAGPDGNPRKLDDDIQAAAATHYGAAGPAFIRAMQERGLDRCITTVREAQHAFREVATAG